LIPDQRRDALLAALQRSGVLSVKELCDLLHVSHMTIRRDITALESEGLVRSVPGGVRLSQSIRSEPTYQDKSSANVESKQAMATLAAGMLHNGQTVFLDAGTTLGDVVPRLSEISDLTVVTNDLTTAVRLGEVDGVDVFQVGGHVDSRNRSTVGSFAADMLRHFNFDLALISTSSWDLDRGVTTPSEFKVAVKQVAMSKSASNVLVAGSEKYGLVGTFHVADLSEFDRVFTDSRFPCRELERLRAAGLDVELADGRRHE